MGKEKKLSEGRILGNNTPKWRKDLDLQERQVVRAETSWLQKEEYGICTPGRNLRSLKNANISK